ncbi:hypothetical protein HOLleu_28078 [Holothuria leucospilota]|uniref:Uncharacterized protein n=1 Tax=Holothuria leucospilota TaxID=206669 RepID=A0A9Q1BRQ6_HOLLE|nr:hypothetical protein HOLleu_28078 [Holothuria leucospilota]
MHRNRCLIFGFTSALCSTCKTYRTMEDSQPKNIPPRVVRLTEAVFIFYMWKSIEGDKYFNCRVCQDTAIGTKYHTCVKQQIPSILKKEDEETYTLEQWTTIVMRVPAEVVERVVYEILVQMYAQVDKKQHNIQELVSRLSQRWRYLDFSAKGQLFHVYNKFCYITIRYHFIVSE